jgi:dTDP-4-dehydrorhamnose 3,5-epimerase-like enzyme
MINLIHLPKFPDERGNLSFLENNNQIPFEIKRVHWIYDVPGGETRGGLAYKETEELIIALSGSFEVVVDNGQQKNIYNLNRSYSAILIPKGAWREINNFSTNAVALIVASTAYDPNDAIRDYEEFLNYSRS